MTAQYHRLRRLPRPCRLWWKAITILTDEIRIQQPLPCEAGNCFQEAAFVVVFAFIKSKRLLIQIPEQMKRLDAHIRAFDAALQQRREIFQSVRVDMTLRVALGMVNDLVNKLVV